MSSHRILYVGRNLALLEHLQAELGACRIVRCPDSFTARLFMAGINYSLLLFDEELPDTTASELADFNCSLEREPCTPVIIVRKPYNLESLARAITEALPKLQAGAPKRVDALPSHVRW